MKSNSLLLATLLLGIGLGIGIGYTLGRWQGNATGGMPQVSTGQQQQTSGKPTASSDAPTKHKRSTTAEAPADTAKRLLDDILHNKLVNAEDPVGRIQFQQALSQCDEATLSELTDEIRKLPSTKLTWLFLMNSDAEDLCHLMVERMATLNPNKALETLLDFKVRDSVLLRTTTVELIFASLSQQDPAQIPAALAKMEAIGIKSEGERAWMLTQAKTDPEAVFQYLMERSEKDAMDHNDLEAIATRLGLYAPEKALTAILQYKGPGDRESIVSEVMLTWFHRNPLAARAYAMAQKDASLLLHCLEGPFSNEEFSALRQDFPEWKSSNSKDHQTLASLLAENLAAQDVNAARQWVATLPTPEQSKANSEIAYQWIDKDPVAASEWLATWPAGEAKESAARSLIRKIQKDDPERAIAWATNCLQGQDRYQKLAEIMKTLAAKDPNAAAAARAALSEEDRTLLNFTEKNAAKAPFAPSP